VCTKPKERRKHAELLCHAMDAWGALKHFAPRGIIYLDFGSGLAYCGETVPTPEERFELLDVWGNDKSANAKSSTHLVLG
jgi:hypothetical protein